MLELTPRSLYGELDEVCFPFFESRRAEHVAQALGLTHAERAVLLTDGYGAYVQYANQTGITHAQCWAHTRRKFFEAQGLLPSNPLTKALAYARERRCALEVYLNDPDVPIDTNHLERALRAIPMGRKNWLFSWTELGARHVGIMQSLIVTCRLHGIDPYDYLVDVLQRVGQHPANRVQELTPRLWKNLFAKNPLRSPLHTL